MKRFILLTLFSLVMAGLFAESADMTVALKVDSVLTVAFTDDEYKYPSSGNLAKPTAAKNVTLEKASGYTDKIYASVQTNYNTIVKCSISGTALTRYTGNGATADTLTTDKIDLELSYSAVDGTSATTEANPKITFETPAVASDIPDTGVATTAEGAQSSLVLGWDSAATGMRALCWELTFTAVNADAASQGNYISYITLNVEAE